MTTYKRIALKDWEITAQNGDYFKIKKGEEYITSKEVNEEVTVFSSFWVDVPIDVFGKGRLFTKTTYCNKHPQLMTYVLRLEPKIQKE